MAGCGSASHWRWSGLAAATGIWRGLAFDVVGIVAGLGAAVRFATYFLIGEHGGLLDPLRVILWSFLVATVALNLVSPLTAFDTELLDDQVSLLGRLADVYVPVWSLLLWVVLLGTLVPFAVELAALGHLRATTVTMIAMIEPVGVSALGWLWFYESLDAVALSAGSLVVAGIVLGAVRAPRPRAGRAAAPVTGGRLRGSARGCVGGVELGAVGVLTLGTGPTTKATTASAIQHSTMLTR